MARELTHNPAKVLQYYLIAQGLGANPTVSTTWPVYHSHLPTSPDNAILVRDTAGTHDGRSMPDGQVFEHHGVQLMIRSQTDATGYAKGRAIMLDFDQTVNNTAVAVNGSNYRLQAISRTSPIIYAGRQQGTTLHLHSVNFLVSIVQTS